MRMISTSKGWPCIKSVEWGLRPSASEISLPAPANFPFGEDQDSSASSLVLIFCIGFGGAHSAIASRDDERLPGDPGEVCGSKNHGGRRDILRLSDAAERSRRLDLLAKIAVGKAR